MNSCYFFGEQAEFSVNSYFFILSHPCRVGEESALQGGAKKGETFENLYSAIASVSEYSVCIETCPHVPPGSFPFLLRPPGAAVFSHWVTSRIASGSSSWATAVTWEGREASQRQRDHALLLTAAVPRSSTCGSGG